MLVGSEVTLPTNAPNPYNCPP
jgi:hypothetical protein